MRNKVAIITGGSSGIGAVIADVLKAKGWEVIAPTHDELDLCDLSAVTEYAKKITAEKSEVRAFIHAAGIWHDGERVLADMPMGTFNAHQIIETMNVGVTSAIVLLNGLISVMKEGTFIGISGTFSDGAKGWLPYYLSKRALEDLILGLSQDAINLRAYGISPADTATEAFKKYYPQYAVSAQSPTAVAGLAVKLLEGQDTYRNGDIIEIRQGDTSRSFHS